MVEFDRLYVLFTPRTGSRSLEKYLIEQGGRNVGIHHTQPDRVPDNKPRYFVSRDPFTQLESWYNIVNTHTRYKTMKDFLQVYGRKEKFKPINMYKNIIDYDKGDYGLIYEWGLKWIAEIIMQDTLHESSEEVPWTFEIHKDLPVIGKSNVKPHYWSSEEVNLARTIFAEDFEFYIELLNNWGEDYIFMDEGYAPT